MPTDLRTYLSERLAEVEAEAGELRQRLAGLDTEAANIRKSAEVTGITLLDLREYDHAGGFRNITKKAERQSEYTIKDAAINILDGLESGLTANEILEIMRDKFGLDYPRSSLSPQLSRLKSEGLVGRSDGRWVLKKYLPLTAYEILHDPA